LPEQLLPSYNPPNSYATLEIKKMIRENNFFNLITQAKGHQNLPKGFLQKFPQHSLLAV